MKACLVVLLTMGLGAATFAQPPQLQWSHLTEEDVHSIKPMTDGGYAAVGVCCVYMYHALYHGFFVRKLDSDGNTEWSHQYWIPPYYVPSWFAEAWEVSQVPDGGFIVACAITDPGYSREPALLRLDSNGEIVWNGTYSDVWSGCYSVKPTPDGGFIACGTIPFHLFKTDSSGDLLWSRDFPATLRSVVLAADGGYAVVGTTDSTSDIYLVKCNSNGDTSWTRTYGGTGDDEGFALHPVRDGGFIIAGSTTSSGGGSSDAMLIRVDSLGQMQWTATYGGTGTETANSVDETFDGGFVFAGYAQAAGNSSLWARHGYLVRINALGDTLWTMQWGDSTHGYVLETVSQTADSGYVVGGWTVGNYAFESGGYIAKLSREGLSADTHVILHPSSFSLSSYPNPFNPTTTLSFTLPKAGRTRIVIYDITGREVRTLEDQLIAVGEHRVAFDGSALPSGIYFARIESGEFSATKKLLLLK